MGIFSSKTKTYVSSTVYNLAGDEDLRPDFLKSVILGTVIRGSNQGIGSVLAASLFSGTGMRQRRFYNWAQTNYDYGMPEATISAARNVPADTVRAGMLGVLGLASNQELRVSTAVIDAADADYWAEFWVIENRPELGEDGWSADFDPATAEVIIRIPGEPDVRLPAPADLIWGLSNGPLGSSRKLLIANYEILTQDPVTLNITQSDPALFVYRMGSGNVTFDTLGTNEVTLVSTFNGSSTTKGFYPAIPLRLNNVSIRDMPDKFDNVKKGYRKLTRSSIDDLLDSIEENDNIGDIDYCFLVQGVDLTSQDLTAKQYLYTFFKSLIDEQIYSKQDLNAFLDNTEDQESSVIQWERWLTAHDQSEPGKEYHPLHGGLAPLFQNINSKPSTNEVRVHSTALSEFDYRIRWQSVTETLHVGNAGRFDGDQTRPLLKPGEFGLHAGNDVLFKTGSFNPDGLVGGFISELQGIPKIFMLKQYARFRYSKLEILGLQHRNYVYQGHSVTLNAADALTSTEEKAGESGFLIPLHYPTLQTMGLLKSTQLSSSSSYLVFNTYVQQKIRWYQRGLFKVILVIASVALSVVFAPAGMAAVGILGTNIAVGTAIGITGAMTAAIVGGVVNAIAALVLTSIISKASVKLFGEKWGAIIGTIVSFVSMQYGYAYGSTGTFNVDWSKIMNVDNIMNLTNSVSNAYSQWLNADTADIFASMEEVKTNYEGELEKIENMADEILGMTAGIIDPMMLTDASEYLGESSETFMGRTLLTGSDIAELTHSMIENFTDISLELPKAIR